LIVILFIKEKKLINLAKAQGQIEYNIGDKESSSDLETGAEPHRLELEEEFGEFLQEIPLYPLLSRGSGMK
jgi:hypothetical protein